MVGIEEKIKDFVKKKGIDVVGVAGPDQLDGAPSTDAGFILKGGKSCVSFAIPQSVDMIYDFFSKKGKTLRNIEKMKTEQKTNHTAADIASFIRSLGYNAVPVMANSVYRRTLNLKNSNPHPDFSHRFAAYASGIAGQGLSGNAVTKEYGAAVFLGSVVTDAVLKSDPMMPPRYMMDEVCSRCLICHQACPLKMFENDKEEYVLLNDQLLPRGYRRDIDLCNINCFGLHSVADDFKWSSWGSHVIDKYLDGVPEPDGNKIKKDFFDKMFSAGDSGSRFQHITHFSSQLLPRDLFTRDKLGKKIEDYPEDELERRKVRSEDMKKYVGIDIKDPDTTTCGQCVLVCAGSDITESARRLKVLKESGIVVKRGDGSHVVVKTVEEAMEIRKNDPYIIDKVTQIKEKLKAAKLGISKMFGLDLKGNIQNVFYQRKLKRAIQEQRPEDKLAKLKLEKSDLKN